MNKKKTRTKEGKLLNKPSTDPGIDRGFELMIRDKRRREQPKTFQIRFGKLVSLFRRELHFNFDVSFDIRKKP